MTGTTFALISLAVWRATLVVTTDTITLGARRRILRRFPARTVPLSDANGDDVPGTATLRPRWPVVAVNCDWCVSPYLAAAACLAAHGAGLSDPWATTLLAIPAAAALAGLLSEVVAWLTR